IGTCVLPLCTPIVIPTIWGKIVEARDHVLITRRSPLRNMASTFLRSDSWMYGPFFLDRDISLPPPACIATPYNKAVRPLIVTSLVTQRGFAPRRLRLATDWCPAFTTTMRMITRVHRRSTHSRTAAHTARTASFATALVLMIDIANLSHRRHTQNMHQALLTRRQTDQGIVPFFCHQLRTRSCPAHHLPATSSRQLDVMDRRTCRDILQGKGIPWPDLGLRPRHHTIPHL